MTHPIDRAVVGFTKSKESTLVDLGCGTSPRNPFRAAEVIGIDDFDLPAHSEGFTFRRADLSIEIPLDDNSADFVTAFDFLEHISRERSGKRISPFINLMNEVYRVLKPGGVFLALTPRFPHSDAFTDPTHVNFITIETHKYFSGENLANTLGYGFDGKFDAELVWADSYSYNGRYWRKAFVDEERNQSSLAPFAQPGGVIGQLKNVLVWLRGLLFRWLPRAGTHVVWILRKPA